MPLLSSTALHGIISNLESSLIDAGNRVVIAEAERSENVRHMIALDLADTTSVESEALTLARDDHARLTFALTEARRMLAEAQKRERDEAEAAARADLRAVLDQLPTLAAQADAAVLKAINDLREVQKTADEARRIARERLNVEIPPNSPGALAAPSLGSLLAEALHWNPRPFQPHASENAGKFARTISDAARLDQQ